MFEFSFKELKEIPSIYNKSFEIYFLGFHVTTKGKENSAIISLIEQLVAILKGKQENVTTGVVENVNEVVEQQIDSVTPSPAEKQAQSVVTPQTTAVTATPASNRIKLLPALRKFRTHLNLDESSSSDDDSTDSDSPV